MLVLAAILEVGGDAFVQWGIRGGRTAGFILGAIVLFSYGLAVNTPRWDFGRLLGIYICVFFVVSQLVAHFVFHQHIKAPVLAGGALVIAGGLVMTFWQQAK